MKEFLHKHRFDLLLASICAFDVIAFSRFPALCAIATTAMIMGMVMDHKKQQAKMGHEDEETKGR